MTQPVDVSLNLDGDYTQGVQQATTATEGLAGALNAIQAPSRSVQQALNAATPSKAHLAAWGGFTAAAAYWQEQTSGIRATASAAGQSMRTLEGDVRRLASAFPIGTSGAVALVQAVQGLGAQQGRILPLAQTFQRLAAATNSFGPEMAQNFGQLNRAMASLDPNRVARFGDVLTTLSAKTGASALGMVNFAQAIAPVAQQAGIGESAVLGISAAFVKLGDDGGAAATAVNKILSDLNRSVREGSNDMAAYAQITGTTVGQFKALYQANPAQALTQVTTAIGRAGPRGQMELESLGLEGVRTQRALLQLSQSGGLSTTINQAIGAYGNGSTQRAAAAAMDGLNSSLTELRSTAGTTADALGGPFLHILTRITDVAKVGLAPVNAVLGSGVGQAGVLGFGAIAASGLLARRVVRPLGVAALGAQVATSGPFRALAGGYATGRTDSLDDALAMRSGRFGREAIAYGAMGAPYGRGFMQPINRGFGQAGSILGQFRSDLAGAAFVPGQGGPGLGGLLSRGGRAGVAASSMAYEGWLRTFADPFHQSVTPASDRVSLLSASSGGLFDRANQARQQAGIKAALGLLEKEGGGASAALSRMASATLGATKAVATFAGRTLEAGAVAGGSALGGVGRGLLGVVGGPVGAALLAGGLGYTAYQRVQSENSANNATMRNTDIYAVSNSWRDAVGAASQAATSMADAMASATNTINASVTNFPSASKVSNADIVAAGKFNAGDQRKNATVAYQGSNTAIQSLIQAGSLTGMTPQDLQGAKLQLIKQGIPADRINQILSGVQTSGTGGRLNSSTVSGLVSAYGAAVASYDKHGHGLLDSDTYAGRDAQKVAQTIAGALGQQQGDLTQQFGAKYATQQTARSIAELMAKTPKNQRYALSHQLAASLGYTGSGGAFTGKELLSLPGVSIGGMSGKDLTGLLTGPGITARLQPSIMEAPLRSAGANALLPFFTSANAPAKYQAGQQAATFLAQGHEADISAQTGAVNQIVSGAQQAGTSLQALAEQASKATSSTADWQQALMAAIAVEAQFRQSLTLQGATRATTLSTQTSTSLATLAAGPGVDPNGFQAKQYAQAKEDLKDQRGAIISFYQQRVMAQYQFQIAAGRAQEDFQRSTARSEQDYFIGRSRAFRDYNLNVSRQAQDAAQQMYNPYQRIQVRPVWDATNLAGNRGEQITAMRRQLADLRRLRQLGLSQSAIDQLQLYDPQNYMQVEELVGDLQASRGEVGTLNRQASQMLGLAGQLVSQSPEARRQKQDFTRSLNDQQADFNRQQARARQDFTISMSRMAQDLRTQDLEITNNMTSLTADMDKILKGQAVDLSDQVKSSLASTLAAVKDYMPKINSALTPAAAAGTGGVVAGSGYEGPGGGRSWTGTPSKDSAGTSFSRAGSSAGVNQGFLLSSASTPGTDMKSYGNPNLHWGADVAVAPDNQRLAPNAKTAQALAKKYGWGSGPEWAALFQIWQQESGFSTTAGTPTAGHAYGIPQAMWDKKSIMSPMAMFGADWKSSASTQIGWGLDYIAHRYGDPLGAWAHKCVPNDAEILTRDGWKHHDEVQVGDETIGYNSATGKSEWTQILEVHHYDDAELVRLENRAWSAVCTPNHRWSARHWGRDDGQVDVMVSTNQITSRHSLRLAAELEQDGLAIDEKEAELLGWLLGDGSLPTIKSRAKTANHWRTKRGIMKEIRLHQAKPEGVVRLDELLRGIVHSRQTRKPGLKENGEPTFSLVTWTLSRGYSDELLKRSGYDHHNPIPFVLSLSAEQRRAFLRGVFGAEGTQRDSSPICGTGADYRPAKIYAQSDGLKQEAIILAVYLDGARPSLYVETGKMRRGYACRPAVKISSVKPYIGGEQVRTTLVGRAPVWCVTTALGTWTMRQGRQVMLTGNSRTGWYGSGGMFSVPTIAGLGEKGPEAVIPLNSQGLEFMVAALRQYVGTADAKLIGSGGLAHATHIVYTNDSYHYDSGQHIHGDVTVKANSPAEWANSAREVQRRTNLTSARGVRWAKTAVSS